MSCPGPAPEGTSATVTEELHEEVVVGDVAGEEAPSLAAF